MADTSKGKSPFYPGQPVPAELFVGRAAQIDRILTRGAGQVAVGKPVAMFVQGEYGIGKSSLAGYVQRLAEQTQHLHGIYAALGGAENLSDVARAVLEGTIKSGALDPTRGESIRNWLAKYIGKQELFGLSLNVDALEKDAPDITTPFAMLEFLNQVLLRTRQAGIKGIFLLLDEINGITGSAPFAHFIKGLVDQNALAREPLPLLLMLCGVEERRREMIRHHRPVDRIFDVIEIARMTDAEMREFFTRSFASARMTVEPDAMDILVFYSAGFPKIMHMIGDAAYWIDHDARIDRADAINAVFAAAEEVGTKYVDQQIYRALRSRDYHTILAKIGSLGPAATTFTRSVIAKQLTESERRKLGNFLQKMKDLNVLRSGEKSGEWVFNSLMVQMYIWLRSPRPEA
jgi:hypothetical protein